MKTHIVLLLLAVMPWFAPACTDAGNSDAVRRQKSGFQKTDAPHAVSVSGGTGVSHPEKAGGEKKQFTGNVEIFITSWCHYCFKLQVFLREKGIPYTAYDIEKDLLANRQYKKLGGRGVPVTKIGSSVVLGYDPNGIIRALERESR